ncbi:uncharacterized protein LOC143023561 isoform X3 [Oratosquilla oratoria]|uniref:uncharacterized protein LOC143023561 isoform X3 n=1 Tax=Oratosquilla oratoria TaxID=337810 RepID=UPI003F762E27
MRGTFYFYCLCFLCSIMHEVFGSEMYDVYNMATHNLCNEKDRGSIFIQPWKAAILYAGHALDKTGGIALRNVHYCEINVSTNEDFGLVVVFEHMKIRGRQNTETNGWECEDYVQVSTIGDKKIYAIMPFDFKDKRSDLLCGERNTTYTFRTRGLFEIGTQANMFSTITNTLEIDFHQSQSRHPLINNSFTAVITTFRIIKDEVFPEVCKDRYICQGLHNRYCISPDFRCDDHINCAFDSSGTDERGCNHVMIADSSIPTTTVIILTLASIIAIAILLCCVFALIKKVLSRSNSQISSQHESYVVALNGAPTAPSLQRQHTLPRYEAVVMTDVVEELPPPEAPSLPELPPSYSELYPDGPPKEAEARSEIK